MAIRTDAFGMIVEPGKRLYARQPPESDRWIATVFFESVRDKMLADGLLDNGRYSDSAVSTKPAALEPKIQALKTKGFRLAEDTDERTLREQVQRGEMDPSLDSLFEQATVDPRTYAAAEIAGVGNVGNGRIASSHITQDPSAFQADLAAGTPLHRGRQGGDHGGGLYFTGAPEAWKPWARWAKLPAGVDVSKPMPEPATLPVELQGKFLNWDRLGSEQRKLIDAATHAWLRSEGYLDERGNATPKGLAVIQQWGNERDLRNEYLRSLGYDGVLDGRTSEGVVWNVDAVRRFGDWQNPRPAPGTYDQPEASRSAALPVSMGGTGKPYSPFEVEPAQPGQPAPPMPTNRQRLSQHWQDFDAKKIDMHEWSERDSQTKRGILDGILKQNPEAVGTVLTDGKNLAVIHKGTIPEEPYRITYFWSDGPSGHAVAISPAQAIAKAMEEGYLDTASPEAVDAIGRTEGFQRAVEYQRVLDFQNELNQSSHEAASAYGRLPQEVRERIVSDPEWSQEMAALRQGRVPDRVQALDVKPASLALPPTVKAPRKTPPTQQEMFRTSETVQAVRNERITAPKKQKDLSDLPLFRPPEPEEADLFAIKKPPPSQTGEAIEPPTTTLSMVAGPVISPELAPDVVKALKWLRDKGSETKTQAGRHGAYSLEGFLERLNSRPAWEMRNAVISIQHDSMRLGSRWMGVLKTAIQQAGKAHLDNLRDVLKGQGAQPETPGVQQAYQTLLQVIHPDTGEIPLMTRELDIRGYTGPGGEVGPEREFTPRRHDLFPRILSEKTRAELQKPGSPLRQRAIDHLVQTGQAESPELAETLLDIWFAPRGGPEGGFRRSLFAPGLQRARSLAFPEDFYVQDVLAAYTRRFNQASRTIAEVRNLGKRQVNVWGNRNTAEEGWLDQIRAEHGEGVASVVQSLMKTAFGFYTDAGIFQQASGLFRNYEVATKLPFIFLRHIPQNGIAAIVNRGLRPWLRAGLETSGLAGVTARHRVTDLATTLGVYSRQAIRDIETQAAMAQAAPFSRLAHLSVSGMSWWRTHVNSPWTARVGELWMQRLDQDLRRGTQMADSTRRTLRRLGMDPEAVQAQGHLTDAQKLRGAFGMLDETQFMERPTAIPQAFDVRGPLKGLGPLIGQFKIYHTRFARTLMGNVITEARHANFWPLAKFLVLAPVFGDLISKSMSQLPVGREP